jgi:hypothetical protein
MSMIVLVVIRFVCPAVTVPSHPIRITADAP